MICLQILYLEAKISWIFTLHVLINIFALWEWVDFENPISYVRFQDLTAWIFIAFWCLNTLPIFVGWNSLFFIQDIIKERKVKRYRENVLQLNSGWKDLPINQKRSVRLVRIQRWSRLSFHPILVKHCCPFHSDKYHSGEKNGKRVNGRKTICIRHYFISGQM